MKQQVIVFAKGEYYMLKKAEFTNKLHELKSERSIKGSTEGLNLNKLLRETTRKFENMSVK